MFFNLYNIINFKLLKKLKILYFKQKIHKNKNLYLFADYHRFLKAVILELKIRIFIYCNSVAKKKKKNNNLYFFINLHMILNHKLYKHQIKTVKLDIFILKL